MNIITKWWNGLTGVKAASAIRMIGQGYQPIVLNGNVVWYADNTQVYIDHGYVDNDIVYSAVNLVMDKCRIAPWGLYKVEDESSLKLYNGLMRKKDFSADDWVKAVQLRRKALVPLEQYNTQSSKLKDLLTWPNVGETFSDLVANSVGYEMLTGNSFWDGDLLGQGANGQLPEAINNLPAHLIQIVATRGYPNRVVGYQLLSGEYKKFTTEQILHIRHFNPSWDVNGSHLYGQSPLRAASKVLKRSEAAKTASVSAFENGGAIGVLYIDDQRMTPDEGREQIEAVKRKWESDYSGPDAYNKVAHSGFKTGFTKINDKLVDLDLISMEDLDLRRLANIWGIPSQLLNDPENKTYNNLKEAEVALTSRCALPKLTTRRDNLNRKLQTDWGFKGVNVYVDFDMSVFTELQEDMAEQTEWIMKSWHLTPRMRYELQQLDIPDHLKNDPLIDRIYVPSGFQDISMLDPEAIDRAMDEQDKLDAEDDKI